MPPLQRQASARLMAWIAEQYVTSVLPVFPHRAFFATSCPDVLVAEIPRIRDMAQEILWAEADILV